MFHSLWNGPMIWMVNNECKEYRIERKQTLLKIINYKSVPTSTSNDNQLCTLSRLAHQVVFVTNIFHLFISLAFFCTSSNSRWNCWYAAKSKIQNTTTTITVTVAALALPCHTGKFIRYWFGLFCWLPVSITQIVQC